MSQQYELLKTARLDLFCVTASELFALGTDKNVFESRGFKNPYGILSEEDLPRVNRVNDVKANPSNIRWYFRLIVDRQSNEVVGSISFHAAPDERGMIEIGLGIAEPKRGNGFATEALKGMWEWATLQPEVKFLRYTVSEENEPSMAIIRKFGFPLIGEQLDEIDGPELIYEISVHDYLTRVVE